MQLTWVDDTAKEIIEDRVQSFGIEHTMKCTDKYGLLGIKLLRGAANIAGKQDIEFGALW